MSNRAREILNKAADLVGKGWTQGARYRNEFGHGSWDMPDTVTSRCMVGAIDEVGGEETAASYEAYKRLYRHLGVDPEGWNDIPGRTKETVVKALRKAALTTP